MFLFLIIIVCIQQLSFNTDLCTQQQCLIRYGDNTNLYDITSNNFNADLSALAPTKAMLKPLVYNIFVVAQFDDDICVDITCH